MDKDRLLELISGLLDGDLSESESRELERELEESEAARDLLESHRRQRAQFESLASLAASEELKGRLEQRLSSLKSSPFKARNLSWIGTAAAACLLFFWGGQQFLKQPAQSRPHYLQPGIISAEPSQQFHSLVLQPNRQETAVFRSQPLLGYLSDAPVQIRFLGDGGVIAGQALRVRLSIDLDGDSQWDLVELSEPLTLDADQGHEEFALLMPLGDPSFVGQPVKGVVKLEFIGESIGAEGIHLLFQPDSSHLVLPITEVAMEI